MAKRDKRLVFVGMGMEIVALIVVASALGSHLDKRYDLKGMASGGLIVLALIGWLYHLIVQLKEFANEKDE